MFVLAAAKRLFEGLFSDLRLKRSTKGSKKQRKVENNGFFKTLEDVPR